MISSAISTGFSPRICRHTDRQRTNPTPNPPSNTHYPMPASTSLLPTRTPSDPLLLSPSSLWSAQGIAHPYTGLNICRICVPSPRTGCPHLWHGRTKPPLNLAKVTEPPHVCCHYLSPATTAGTPPAQRNPRTSGTRDSPPGQQHLLQGLFQP